MASLQDILTQLQAQAGPRGATLMGRHVTPEDTLQSIMTRLPIDTGDAEGLGGIAASGGLAGAIRAGGKKFTDAPAWRVAPKGSQPLTDPSKLYPAIINARTGEVAVAGQPGIGQHDILRRGFGKDPTVRSFGDPTTRNVHPDFELGEPTSSSFFEQLQGLLAKWR